MGRRQAEFELEEAQRVLDVAVDAARAAGERIVARSGAAVIKTKMNPKDLLTEVDSECQAIVENVVRTSFPTHQMLGEESVEPGANASRAALEAVLGQSRTSEWLWIIDPIDGTINFAHDMPLSAVSIGVAFRGTPVIGVIYEPYHDELFYAIRGHGAFLTKMARSKKYETAPMRVSKAEAIEECVVCAGSPPNPRSMAPTLRGINALMPRVRTVRMLGSAAIMLAYVAAGRIECYWEPDLNSWDVAAGAVLVREAGGVMGALDGSDYHIGSRAIIASCSRLAHNNVLQVLHAEKVFGLDPET